MMDARSPVAILGCGLIGESWTALMVWHGLDVVAWDPNETIRNALPERIERGCAQLSQIGGCNAPRGSLTLVETVEDAVVSARWIQENAPEKVPLKQALYAQIEAAAPADAVIASSTSSLTWTELSTSLERPERLITAHPFNPPHLMPLVEIYAHNQIQRERADAFYRALGRETVFLEKPATGHIANRLASALWREAVNIVAEGIADVPSVDAALVHGPGLRWSVIGAHMAYHLGGGAGGIEHYLDHLGPSQERRWATLGTPSLTPWVCDLLVEGVAREADGRTIDELEAQRDQALIAALAARRTTRGASGER